MADLQVRVQPGSSQNKLECHDGVLKVWVNAPPVEGAANEAVIKLISKRIKVPKSSISIIRGESSREKTLRIAGRTDDEVIDSLTSPS
ncbi:MAG TPA: DUF167 domain-containing protein [Fimbriimonas sp.]|nr:DUF167 domain-containing protein [Fimbriimonas sp.]